jgi:SAM-dependent methyltransferase
LLLNKATPSRVLAEIEFENLCATEMSGGERILVAGGSRGVGGSEHAALSRRMAETSVFVDLLPSRIPDVAANLTDCWPFRDNTFDVVVSTWVVEHLPDPAMYFRETFRVLRRPGFFLCAVPFLYRQHGSPQDFVRLTDDGLRYHCSAAGFDEMRVHRVGGGPLMCCVSLLWPILGVPVFGLATLALAAAGDRALTLVSRLAGRRGEVLQSYPLAYVLAAQKRG